MAEGRSTRSSNGSGLTVERVLLAILVASQMLSNGLFWAPSRCQEYLYPPAGPGADQ